MFGDRHAPARRPVLGPPALCAAVLSLSLVPAVPVAAQAKDALKQVAGVLDYIAGDYRGAVDDRGQVLEPGEYEEQLSLAADAARLAVAGGVAEDDPLRRALAELEDALRRKLPPAEITELCKIGRARLVSDHHVVLSPAAPPSLRDGERLYRETGCRTCHGDDGSADTEAARQLDPHPANFLDPERVAAVSPHRAFFAITFGVEGTGMTGYPQLSDSERWSLAFYVLSLRHARGVDRDPAQDRAQAQALLAGLAEPPPSDARRLAGLTEEELLARLGALPDAAARDRVLAYLRGVAPFAEHAAAAPEASDQPARLAVARERLRAGLAAYRAGDVAGARQAFVSAYLDGFEPYEAAIGARDAELVREVEAEMLALRQGLGAGVTADDLGARVGSLVLLLDRAEQGDGEGSTAFAAAFTIALREGFEIALLVGALLALVRRRGSVRLVRYVHAGWLLAIPAGFLTWLLAAELLGGLQRELAEGIAALVAAVVLLGVTHWLFGQLTARRFMGFLGERFERAFLGRAASVGVLSLAFVAAYREAFEIVLFFQALLLDVGERTGLVWLGAASGLGVLIAVTYGLRRIGQRLPARAFMLFSSGLLSLLAWILVGKGVRAFQEAAVLPIHSVSLPDIEFFGFYGTVEGLLAQAAMFALLAASALWPLLRRRIHDAPQPAE